MKLIVLIYDRLKIFKFLDTSQYRCKFAVIYSAVVKNHPINIHGSEIFKGSGQSIAMADAQSITFQAQSSVENILEQGENKLMIFVTLEKVLKLRVIVIPFLDARFITLFAASEKSVSLVKPICYFVNFGFLSGSCFKLFLKFVILFIFVFFNKFRLKVLVLMFFII